MISSYKLRVNHLLRVPHLSRATDAFIAYNEELNTRLFDNNVAIDLAVVKERNERELAVEYTNGSINEPDPRIFALKAIKKLYDNDNGECDSEMLASPNLIFTEDGAIHIRDEDGNFEISSTGPALQVILASQSAEWQTKMGPLIINFAYTTSPPIADGFGGGVFVITNDSIQVQEADALYHTIDAAVPGLLSTAAAVLQIGARIDLDNYSGVRAAYTAFMQAYEAVLALPSVEHLADDTQACLELGPMYFRVDPNPVIWGTTLAYYTVTKNLDRIPENLLSFDDLARTMTVEYSGSDNLGTLAVILGLLLLHEDVSDWNIPWVLIPIGKTLGYASSGVLLITRDGWASYQTMELIESIQALSDREEILDQLPSITSYMSI